MKNQNLIWKKYSWISIMSEYGIICFNFWYIKNEKICLIIGLLIILIPWVWFAYWYFGIYNPKTLIEYYPNGQISND